MRHPWILDITDDPPIGPNSVRHFDQSMQAVASLPIPLAEKFDIVDAVDEYVFGFCLHERNNVQSDDDPFDADDGRLRRTTSSPPATTRSSRRSSASTDSKGPGPNSRATSRDPQRFERGLERVLDGVATAFDLPPAT